MGYHDDHRIRAAEEHADREAGFDRARMLLSFSLMEDDPETGETVESIVSFPAKFEVCPTCEGKGTHAHPSIDAHGISQDEWASWSDEEQESYRSGGYDVTCFGCAGERVVPVINEGRLSDEQRKQLVAIQEQREMVARDRQMERAERELGA